GEHDDVLVDAEDLNVGVGQRDRPAVERREEASDPEAAEVRGLPVDGEPEIAAVARLAKPHEVEVGDAREEYQREEPHEMDARMARPGRIQEVRPVRVASDRPEELE